MLNHNFLIRFRLKHFTGRTQKKSTTKKIYEEGRKKRQEGDLNSGIYFFTEALKINPKFGPAFYERGLSFALLGKMEKAKSDFRKYLELTKNLEGEDVHKNRIVIYSRFSELKKNQC